MSLATHICLNMKDFMHETRHLDAISFRAVFNARCHQREYGELPSDIGEVIGIMGLHGVDASAIATKLLVRYFDRHTNGTWVHTDTIKARQVELAEKARKSRVSMSYSIRGTMGAAARWKNHVAKRPSKRSTCNGSAIAVNGSSNAVLSSSSTPPLPFASSGNVPPVTHPPAKVTELRASHTPPARQAAKRNPPRRAVAPPPNGSSAHLEGAASVAVAKLANAGVENREVRPPTEPQDPRFSEIEKELRKFWGAFNGPAPMPWDNADKRALSLLLRSSPTLTLGYVQRMLRHRAASIEQGEENGSAMPRAWVAELPKWLAGPLNRYGGPLKQNRRPPVADDGFDRGEENERRDWQRAESGANGGVAAAVS